MRWSIVWLAAATLCAGVRQSRADPAYPHHLFTRGDLVFGLAAVGLTAAAVPNDEWLTEESTEGNSVGERRLASIATPLGSGALVLGTLAAVYGAGRLMHHDGLAASATRVGLAVLASGATALAMKEGIGRARPLDSPNDSDDIMPFRGDKSFPSGHATVAFALASAVSHETHDRWVSWALYPVAAAVAWSRVHDNEHWTSDVVAGAFLGGWIANKTERIFELRAKP
jgi:membrane-associated phospholipid phosphatase